MLAFANPTTEKIFCFFLIRDGELSLYLLFPRGGASFGKAKTDIICLCRYSGNASARCFDKLNMTENLAFVKKTIIYGHKHCPVIPSEVETSRGNEPLGLTTIYRHPPRGAIPKQQKQPRRGELEKYEKSEKQKNSAQK